MAVPSDRGQVCAPPDRVRTNDGTLACGRCFWMEALLALEALALLLRHGENVRALCSLPVHVALLVLLARTAPAGSIAKVTRPHSGPLPNGPRLAYGLLDNKPTGRE